MSIEKIWAKGVTRRDFIKLCSAAAAALGLSETMVPKFVSAAEKAAKKPPVIWLEGQDCAGCTESFASNLNPGTAEILLDTISLRYHETLMAGTGDVAEHALEQTLEEGNYILVVEGSIPTVDDRFCVIGGKPFRETLLKTAEKAAAIIAFGTCSAYGGINAAAPTKSVGVQSIVKDKPVINLPGCPGKPSRLVATLLYYLSTGNLPQMDKYNRPLAFYGKLHHDNCPRRGHFEAGHFLTDWNDPKQVDWCLLLVGCKGPKTYTDCPQVWWNDGASYCVNAGSPCSGCTQPEYYAGFAPLYVKQENFMMPGVAGISADTVGKVLGGATAVGLGAHLAGSVAAGRLSKNKRSHNEPLTLKEEKEAVSVKNKSANNQREIAKDHTLKGKGGRD